MSHTKHTNAGTYAADYWSFTDPTGNYNNVANTTITDTITKAQTNVMNVTVTPNSQQYSDKVDLSALVTSSPSVSGNLSFYINCNAPLTFCTPAGGTQQFLGTVAVTTNNTGTVTGVALLETVASSMTPGSHTITAVFTPLDTVDFTSSRNTAPLTIIKEDADVTYTGAYVVATSGLTVNTVTIPLTFTVRDSSLYSSDTSAGDILKSKFTILVDSDSTTCASLTPTLFNSSDHRSGTILCNYTFTVPSNSGYINPQLSIQDASGGYYTASSINGVLAEPFPISVSLGGQSNFITGGGYILNQSSAGQYPGDLGMHTNLGFNVKYNKSGTNLQGNANIILRVGGRIYQIKTTSMQSLAFTANTAGTTGGGTGTFISKANLTDITDPNNPLSVYGSGGTTLTVNFTDNGTGASAPPDTIGIQLYNGSTLVYSSNWDGAKTIQQRLGGGNMSAK